MDITWIIMLVCFLATVSLVALLITLLTGDSGRLKSRLNELAGHGEVREVKPAAGTLSRAVQSAIPRMGKSLLPGDAEELTRLKARLLHAGVYHPQGPLFFLGIKMLLIVGPALLGLLAGFAGILPLGYALLGGAFAGIIGMIGPSLWLDRRKAKRQATLRRSLPDALDLMVVCMEGGLSLDAALQRVSGELKIPHPVLGLELSIVQREVQLGHPTGEALRSFSMRTDLDDVRNLAATVKNAQQFGASLVKSLRTFAETLRLKRQQSAEEMAHKAGTKMLFPTMLFIFPAIFVIILGPAAVQILDTFAKMEK